MRSIRNGYKTVLLPLIAYISATMMEAKCDITKVMNSFHLTWKGPIKGLCAFYAIPIVHIEFLHSLVSSHFFITIPAAL